MRAAYGTIFAHKYVHDNLEIQLHAVDIGHNNYRLEFELLYKLILRKSKSFQNSGFIFFSLVFRIVISGQRTNMWHKRIEFFGVYRLFESVLLTHMYNVFDSCNQNNFVTKIRHQLSVRSMR